MNDEWFLKRAALEEGMAVEAGGESADRKVPKALDSIVDTVLTYRPKARSKPAVQRKRRKTILEKKKQAASEHRCAKCGFAIAAPGLCGECSCEDDGAIW